MSRDLEPEILAFVRRVLARDGRPPSVKAVSLGIAACSAKTGKIYRELRERGELPPLAKAYSHGPIVNLPEHHELRMAFHEARLEVGGEAVPNWIKAKYRRLRP
jgi:hypothetical protein